MSSFVLVLNWIIWGWLLASSSKATTAKMFATKEIATTKAIITAKSGAACIAKATGIASEIIVRKHLANHLLFLKLPMIGVLK